MRFNDFFNYNEWMLEKWLRTIISIKLKKKPSLNETLFYGSSLRFKH